ncbi:MAG: sugar ABC transporter permease, partial [Lachnospiraceae bacterium]|nr:sugar ABC transporter permease [Lachnospiraceae bacterium]
MGKKDKTSVAPVVKKKNFFQLLWKYRTLTLMCIPAIVFFFMFSYMPMPGIWVAFVKYNYRKGIFGSKFVGLKNFQFIAESG